MQPDCMLVLVCIVTLTQKPPSIGQTFDFGFDVVVVASCFDEWEYKYIDCETLIVFRHQL